MMINGQEADGLDPSDRGLHYGDGVFETIAVTGSQPLQWSRHIERLKTGCRCLGFQAPDADDLWREAQAEIRGRKSGVLKILVTRGSGGRGYRPPESPSPTRIIICYPGPEYPFEWWTRGIRLRVCELRLSSNPRLAGIKHLNRLEQVLARGEWDDKDIAEGLVRDTAGRVIEATTANLFILRDGCLMTPGIERCGVAGIMRARVLEQARSLDIPVRVDDFTLEQVEEADALFLTNSVIGCWPVRELSGRAYDLHNILPKLYNWLMKQGLYGLEI